MEEEKSPLKKVPAGTNRMPADSVFYDKLVPILLITLGIIMVLIVIIAAGILLGLI